MNRIFSLAVVGLATFAAAAPASALLLGNTVQVSHEFPAIESFDFGPQDYTVGSSGPASYFGIANISANDTQFIVDVFCGTGCTWSVADFNGFGLFDTYGTVSAFTSVSINGATSYAGLTASRVTFTANSIRVDLNGLDANGTLVLDINGTVPEPTTWALMIGGFGMVGAVMRRRKSLVAA